MKRAAVPLGLLLLLLLQAAPARPAADNALREAIAAARRVYEQGSWDEARRRFLDITARHGDESDARDAWYYLALLARPGDEYLGDLDQYLDHGGRRDPRGPYVLLRAGRYWYSIGEYRNALTRFEEARQLRHDDLVATSEARYWVGLTLMALREPGDARRALEEAALPGSPAPIRQAALFARGELFRTNRDYAGAARAYAEYRQAFPNGDYAAASLFGEASASDLLGRRNDAAGLYTELVRLYADHPEAAQARAWLKAAATGEGPATARRPPGPPSGGPGAAGPASPAPTESTPAGGEAGPAGPSGYSVQVGAFASQDNALKVADDLLGRGYSRVRVERGNEEPRLYHVRFGNYADQSRAVRAGEEVSATLGLKFQIVPPPEPR